MTLRVGILGNGGIAARHAASIAQLPDRMELVAVCGRDEARVRAFTDTHGGTAFTDADAMIAAGIDIMIDAAPPFSRGGESVRAAERGVNLLVEKPISLDVATGAAMVHAAEKSGVRAAIGFMYRHGKAVQRWQAANVGPVGLMAGSYHCNALHAPWWRVREQSGGQILEQLLHVIDVMRLFMGEPDSVYARKANLFHGAVPGYDVEDVSAMIFGWDDGRIATLNASNIAEPGKWDKRWSLYAEKAVAHFGDWNHASFIRTAPDVAAEEWESDQDPFVAQLADLADAIAEQRSPLVPLTEGAATLKLALAAVRSSEEGRAIRLADAF